MAPETQPASAGTDHAARIDERDRRALEQYLTVLDDVGIAADADGLYVVVSESGRQYLVDVRGNGTCRCPDARHRDVRCKHWKRVLYATGRKPIPEEIPREDIDDQLGEQVADDPVYAGDAVNDESDLIPDGGVTTAPASSDDSDATGRPANCQCTGDDVPCWPCYQAGFETSAVTEEDA